MQTKLKDSYKVGDIVEFNLPTEYASGEIVYICVDRTCEIAVDKNKHPITMSTYNSKLMHHHFGKYKGLYSILLPEKNIIGLLKIPEWQPGKEWGDWDIASELFAGGVNHEIQHSPHSK